MSRASVLVLLLVIALAIPPVLHGPTVDESETGKAFVALAASSSTAPEMAADTLAAARKRDHRQSDGRERERKPERRERRQQVKSDGVSVQELARQEERCEAAGDIWLPQVELCTHGPDPAPPGVDLRQRAAPLPAARARAAAKAVTCDGDGHTGPRVQVLYARPANVPSHYATYLDSFRAWASNVDAIVRSSAAEAGGGRRVRFVTAGCVLDIPEAVLSPAGDDTFQNTIAQLQARGYNRTDRKYLVFVDSTTAGICGIGNRFPDDRPQQSNPNNSGPLYARVDAPCWDASVVPTHELFHTLGAVQASAQNSTGHGHCVDEWDVMCYSDPPNFPAMHFDCPDPDDNDRLDCNHNDYFDPSPVAGGYLSTHWNTADSRFLVATAPESADAAPPTVTWVSPVTNDEEHIVNGGTVALQVAASDSSGIDYVHFQWYDEVRDLIFDIGRDFTEPYTATLEVAKLQPENNDVYATAYDAWGNSTEEAIYLWNERTDPPPDPTPEQDPDYLTLEVTSPDDGATLTAGVKTDVAVVVSNAPVPTVVEVRACSGETCSWPSATSLGSDGSAPYQVSWQPQGAGATTLLARADDADQTLSEPVTVNVKKQEPPPGKDKKKKKKKHKKKKH